jgi:diguanylate cyclase (GGDEF)-like protein
MERNEEGVWNYQVPFSDLDLLVDRLREESVIFPHEYDFLRAQIAAIANSKNDVQELIPAVEKDIILLLSNDTAQLIVNRRQERIDFVTLLPFRVALFSQIEKWLEEDLEQKLGLFIIELDDFSNVNDVAGHSTGDIVLYQIARRLEMYPHHNSRVVRLHGDEFGILVKDIAEVEDIWDLAKWITNEVERPIIVSDREFYIKPSIGIAIYPHLATTAIDLVKNAYVALHQAKSDGLESAKLYQLKFDSNLRYLVELESELNEAILEKSKLEVWYQPKQNLETNKICGLEALVRWRHPTLGLVSPADFIPLAERTGLICKLTDLVISQVCQDLPSLRSCGFDSHVSINFSAKDFLRKTIVKDVLEILQAKQVSPEDIEIEITEGAFIADFENCYYLLTHLKEQGFTISIDDFGTGYSSLSYLAKLPVDVLKIDMAFIKEIHSSDKVKRMYKAMIDIAKALDLVVVSEGVDNKNHKEILKSIGCDVIQGYLLTQPLALPDIKNYLKEHCTTSTP